MQLESDIIYGKTLTLNNEKDQKKGEERPVTWLTSKAEALGSRLQLWFKPETENQIQVIKSGQGYKQE